MTLEGIDFFFRKIRPQVQTQPSKRAIDKTVATKIVALDGTGDFDNIQAAINALPSTGGIVYIKEGTYPITTSIALGNKTTLQGAGRGTKLRADAAVSVINTNLKTEVRISNLEIDAQAQSGITCIGLSNCNEAMIDGVWITGGYAEGIRLSACARNIVSNCYLEHTANYNSEPMLIDGNGADHNIITGNKIVLAGSQPANGIRLWTASGTVNENTILGNNISGAAPAGAGAGININVAGVEDTLVVGNTVINSGAKIYNNGTRSKIWGNIGEQLFTAASSTVTGTIKFAVTTSRNSTGWLSYY